MSRRSASSAFGVCVGYAFILLAHLSSDLMAQVDYGHLGGFESAAARDVLPTKTQHASSPLGEVFVYTGFPGLPLHKRIRLQMYGKHPYELVIEEFEEGTKRDARMVPLQFPDDQYSVEQEAGQGTTKLKLRSGYGHQQWLQLWPDVNGPDAPAVAPVKSAAYPYALRVPLRAGQGNLMMLTCNSLLSVPRCTWSKDGRVLSVKFDEQQDEILLDRKGNQITGLQVERMAGAYRNHVLVYGRDYQAPAVEAGELIGHWAFESIVDGMVRDLSGHGGVLNVSFARLASGVRGAGIDGCFHRDLTPVQHLIPSRDEEYMNSVLYAACTLQSPAFRKLKDSVSISFWFAPPPAQPGTVYRGYEPYIKDATLFDFNGVRMGIAQSWQKWQRPSLTVDGGHDLLAGIGDFGLPVGQWSHLVLTAQGSRLQLFVNGDLWLDTELQTPLASRLKGEDPIRLLEKTYGRLDELRLYSKRLNYQEIRRLYLEDKYTPRFALDFEQLPLASLADGLHVEGPSLFFEAKNASIVQLTADTRVLQFAEKGGSITIPEACFNYHDMDTLTLSARIKMPDEKVWRQNAFIGTGNHGHIGLFLSLGENGRVDGQVSHHGLRAQMDPESWSHLLLSYSAQRHLLEIWVDGKKVTHDEAAYPNPDKGDAWGMKNLTFTYDGPMMLDDIVVLNFRPTEGQVQEIANFTVPSRLDPGKSVAITSVGPCRIPLRLCRQFTDHMVLQRGKPITLFGEAMPGEAVSLTLAGRKGSTVADLRGHWSITLAPFELISEPQTLTVKGQGREVSIQDVVVGDVYFLGGQSNMWWPWKFMQKPKIEAISKLMESGVDDHIRYYIQTTGYAREPQREPNWPPQHGGWSKGESPAKTEASSLGLFFAMKLRETLGPDHPIGLICAGKGGTVIAGHMEPSQVYREREAFIDVPSLAPWLKGERELDGTVLQHNNEPFTMYNSFVHPWAAYPVAALAWYQGESDGGGCRNLEMTAAITRYENKLKALIRGWRNIRGDHLPFYTVQLANFSDENPGMFVHFDLIREAQRRSLDLPKTGLVITADIGDVKNIHPNNKWDAGLRFARWVLRDVYGKNDLIVSGPLVRRAYLDKSNVIIEFNHADGLALREGLTPLFEVSADGKAWSAVEANIDGLRIVLPVDTAPKFLRYAAGNNPSMALINAAGLPASPFIVEIQVDRARDGTTPIEPPA